MSASDPPPEPTPTIDEAIAEIKRELAIRENIYPKWIEAGKLERPAARKYYARMRMALRFLQALAKKPNAP